MKNPFHTYPVLIRSNYNIYKLSISSGKRAKGSQPNMNDLPREAAISNIF